MLLYKRPEGPPIEVRSRSGLINSVWPNVHVLYCYMPSFQ